MSAELVKTLRQMTQAGIKECSDALKENNFDLDAAADYLRRKGLIKAVKKADREAKDGLEITLLSSDLQTGVLLEFACETDFVARNEKFQALGNSIARQVLDNDPQFLSKNDVPAETLAGEGDQDSFLKAAVLLEQEAAWQPGVTVLEAVQGAIATIGENMAVRRFARFARNGNPGVIMSYIHQGSKLGVMVELESSNEGANTNEKVKELVTNICLHIAFTGAPYLSREEVPADVVAKERSILLEQLADSNKPAPVKEKIVDGRLSKFFSENCLLEQISIIDQESTIAAVIARTGKEIGQELGLVRYVRFALGS